MTAHPYRLIGERIERSLRRELEPIIADWAKDWLADNLSFGCERLTPFFDYCREESFAEIHKLVSWVDDNWCGLLEPVEAAPFGAMLIAMPSKEMDELTPSILLPELARQALIELAQRILAGARASHDSVPFFVTENGLPKGAELRGSGAIVLRVRVAALQFDYLVSPATVERYLKEVDEPPRERRRELASLPAALGSQKVNARISLGSAELSLSELATIRIGDVVKLDRTIDEPAWMKFGADGFACEGFVGVKEESLAFLVSQIAESKT